MTTGGLRRDPRRARLQAIAAAATLLATACGSTLPAASHRPTTSQLAPQGAAAAGGTRGAVAGSGLATTGDSGSQPAALGGSTSAGTGNASSTGSTANSAAAPGRAGAPGSVRAPRTGPIEVGFIAGKCSNCTSLGTAYTPPTYSDQQLEQAAVNGLNARGGIGGRRINPIFATVDTASASWTTQYQAACATFTQDHHVVAVLGYSFAYEENLAACLARAGVLWINGGYGAGDLRVYRSLPYYFSDIAPSEDAELVVSVSSAVEDGWVTTKSKLGILQANCNTDARAFDNSLKPYLEAHHLQLVSNEVINCVTGAQDDGSAAARIQQAELHMRTNGVDNVIITGIPLILFGEDAESQQWRPHYLAFLGGGVYQSYLPPAQLSNIHAVGWLPTLDLDAAHLPPLTAAQKECKDLLHAGGIDIPPSQYNSAFIACDGVLLYAQGVTQAGGATAPAAVSNALQSLGNRHVSPMTLNGATLFTPSQHAAPQTYRSNLYQSGCSCFEYVGPVRPLPTL